MEPEKKTTKKMDLLTAVEKIVDLSKGSQLHGVLPQGGSTHQVP